MQGNMRQRISPMPQSRPVKQVNFDGGSSNVVTVAAYQSITIRRYRLALAACIFIIIVLLQNSNIAFLRLLNGNGCAVSLHGEKYQGHTYIHPKNTLDTTCLVESRWMKLSRHSVRLPNNSGKDVVVDDWLFIDHHDRINVLVEAPHPKTKGDNKERKFILFQQTKYGLEGLQSLAVVGGVVEPMENPFDSAKREVNEELNGLVCHEWIFLGRFRTDVNRGLGWIHSFVALDCSYESPQDMFQEEEEDKDQVGAADAERQDKVIMSKSQLMDAAKSGKILEAQWSNTIMLALAHARV